MNDSRNRKTGELEILPLNYSLAKSYHIGEMTLHEVAMEFAKYGWTNFVDESFAKRQMDGLEYAVMETCLAGNEETQEV